VAIHHPVGIPKDLCEKKVLDHLKEALPDGFHIYNNLELIPRRGGHPFEYDLIIIGPFSIWVIEVKNYRGNIRGNANSWELANGRFERSPIPLTNDKARVLKSNITEFLPRLKAHVYVDALVVLCDENSRIVLNDPQSDRVLHISDVVPRILNKGGNSGQTNIGQEINLVNQFLHQRFRPLEPKKYIGEYEVEDTMADWGAICATYPAKHRLLHTQGRISLKLFQTDISLTLSEQKKQVEFFIHEAEAHALLGEHPNIVRCYPPFLWEADKVVMPLEWIDGPTLQELLDKGISISLETRLEIFRQLCAGLAHAHKHGIVHRAISPSNIIISPDQHVKIVNFKCAKIDDALACGVITADSFSSYSSIDLRYLAPELSREIAGAFHKATPSSDIYSLGIVFYQLLTGRFPLDDPSVRSIKEVRKPSANYMSSQLCEGLDDIFLKMCKTEPDMRYLSCDEILANLPGIQ
jgi:serine/threonine protein kinase